MAFLVSPGVEVNERDLTNIIPAVSTSTGAFAGVFEWGPANEVVSISSERDLISKFGYPRRSTRASTAITYTGSTGAWTPRDDWYTASNFLGYSTDLRLARILPDGARNAASEPFIGTSDTITVKLEDLGTDSEFAFYEDVTFSTVKVGEAVGQEIDITVLKAYKPDYSTDTYADVPSYLTDINTLKANPLLVAAIKEDIVNDSDLTDGQKNDINHINDYGRIDVDITDPEVVANYDAEYATAIQTYIDNNGITAGFLDPADSDYDPVHAANADSDATAAAIADRQVFVDDIVAGLSTRFATDNPAADGRIIEQHIFVLQNAATTIGGFDLDRDSIRKNILGEEIIQLAVADENAGPTAAEIAIYEADIVAQDARIDKKIQELKAAFAYDYIDLKQKTHGALLWDDLVAEVKAVTDINDFDSDNSIRWVDSADVKTYQLDFNENKAYNNHIDATAYALQQAREVTYAAMVDTVMATPALNRIGEAFKTDLENSAHGFTNVSYAHPYITYDKVTTNLGTLSADQIADITEKNVKFSYTEAPTMAAGISAYTENVIANEDNFLNTSESLTSGSVHARYPGVLGNALGVIIVDSGVSDSDFNTNTLFGTTTLSDLFDTKPGTSVRGEATHSAQLEDEVHVVVYTTSTTINGTDNDVLEIYPYLSKDRSGKSADGASNYYVEVVNNQSSWVYLLNEETAATDAVTPGGISIGTLLTTKNTGTFNKILTNISVPGIRMYDLNGGLDGVSISDANVQTAFDLFKDVELLDISIIMTGSYSKVVQKYVADICQNVRKDCVCVISPDYNSAVVSPTADKIADYFNNDTDGFSSNSYAIFDSGWKRQYDRHNDEYFWIPLNADVAGLMARTDYTNDPWWSPAGLNRGFIQNVVKLSFNPNQTDRDTLYSQRINPVVTFRGQGTVLYGDKTALSRPSAFDRINVRRLFIVLEKAIATASKYYLFEFNDDITRRSFINAVEPYLNNIRTRRGLTDFRVVCDTTNNTPEIIDANRFVADIYIKPTRSINFITLNFIAVRSGVSFNEIAG